MTDIQIAFVLYFVGQCCALGSVLWMAWEWAGDIAPTAPAVQHAEEHGMKHP